MLGFLKFTAFGTYTKIITFEEKVYKRIFKTWSKLNNLTPTKSLVKKL